MSDKFYLENFNTRLSIENEQRFNNWIRANIPIVKRNLFQDVLTYDLRGWWLENNGKMLSDPSAHLPDTFKKPNHPTFSNESIYHNTIDPVTKQKYVGGQWVETDGRWGFTPSPQQLLLKSQIGWGAKPLQKYFKEQEQPDTTLNFPSFKDIFNKDK